MHGLLQRQVRDQLGTSHWPATFQPQATATLLRSQDACPVYPTVAKAGMLFLQRGSQSVLNQNDTDRRAREWLLALPP